MNKVYTKLLALLMAMILFHLQVLAGATPSVTASFDADNAEAEIYEAFNDIDELVSLLNETDDVTYETLQANNSVLIENVSNSAAVAMSAQEKEGPPIVSAFLWGCVLNWVGLLVVYLTTDSNKEFTKKAWSGCLVNTGCYAGLWLIAVLTGGLGGVLGGIYTY
ncbi:MAG: hypothetical protein JW735_00025 [Prolixibacteraceae bacterium]|jgi:hypothetical protein|nr:hypothetical protein [Prolixibacteraceae bacterium]